MMKEITIEREKEYEITKDEILELFKMKAHELYKMDWKKTHITEDIERKTIEEYHRSMFDDITLFNEDVDKLDSYEDWVWECGYANGMMCACYGEFIDHEFMDAGYMKHILSDKDFKFYLENFEYDEDSLDDEESEDK